MTSWKTYKLGDLCKISSSKRIFAKEYKDSGIPFYRGKEIIEKQKGNKISTELYISQERYEEIKTKHGVPQKGDMLLTSVGTLGIPYIVQDEVFYFKDGNLTWFYDFEGLDSRYLYYWFLSPIGKMNINSKAIGSTQKALTIETLSKFEISLPGLEEQRRIAGILGAIDDKIENNRRINTNLELQAQALYKQWFVDNRSDDWGKKKLESIIDIGSGKGLARIDFVEDGLYPILGANGQIGRTNNFLIDKKDNVLFTGRVGTLGNVFRLQQKRAWLSDNTLIITPKKKYYNYVYFFLKSSNLKDFNVGSTQPLIRQSDIKEMDILIPDYLTLEAFENKCIAMFDKINQANAEIDSLASLRDTLLPKLMNGEIKIDE